MRVLPSAAVRQKTKMTDQSTLNSADELAVQFGTSAGEPAVRGGSAR